MIYRREWERKEKGDPGFEGDKGFTKCGCNLFRRSLCRRWIGHTPMCGSRMSRPYRASFLGGTIAHGKDEVEFWSIGLRELIPALAPGGGDRDICYFQLPQCFRADSAGRMTSSAVGREFWTAHKVHDGFGHDRACRVASAEEKHVVVILHRPLSCSRSDRNKIAWL